MGVAFKDLIGSVETSLENLGGKIIVLDSYNILYQFITTIRGADGTPLMDSNGKITSHLAGLFSRTANMMQKGIKLVFVFDGKPPALKQKVYEQRNSIKLEAQKQFLEAKKEGDEEQMKKYASRTSRLNKEMVEDSKKLISLLGLPIVQAPSEGEAQAAYMVNNNNGYAVGSQDFDSLIHGATRLIRNLSVSGRRKKIKTAAYETIKPELIDLSQNLNHLGVDQNQLIALAMLIGTDYNPGGIKGIGPKNALKLVRRHKTDFDALFKEIKWNDYFNFEWTEVYYLIKKMPVTDKYKLNWGLTNEESIISMLVDKHSFSEKRVMAALGRIRKESPQNQQKSLGEF